jgi:hypothetical protein
MHAFYQLLPKGSFRVFKLAPASIKSAPLVGELVIFSLSANVEYQALSYVWGGVRETGAVLVSGNQATISANLDRALRRVRSGTGTLTVWIDQLCINQADYIEKAEQVSQMDKIYSGAKEVIVILCACIVLREEPTPAERTMRLFVNKVAEFSKGSLETHLAESCFKEDPNEIVHIHAFVHCDWWYRMWTVQELVFARHLTFIWHNDALSIDIIHHFCEWWDAHMMRCCALGESFSGMAAVEYSEAIRRAREMFELRKRYMKLNTAPSLLELLVMTGNRSASTAHDNIYSLASLTQMPQSWIDYKLTPVECYTNFARHTIEISGQLGIFRYLNSTAPRPEGKSNAAKAANEVKVAVEGLPSWAPNWSVVRDGIGQKGLDGHHRLLNHYNASGHTAVQIVKKFHPLMALRGTRCTTIATVSSSFEHIEPSPSAVLEIWACVKDFDAMCQTKYAESVWSEGDFYELAVSLLGPISGGLASVNAMMDSYHRLHTPDPMATPLLKNNKRVELLNQLFYQSLAQDDENNEVAKRLLSRLRADDDTSAEDITDRMSYSTLVALKSMCKHLITTVDGHYGFAPVKAQPGDLICVLYGGNTPFVLRKDTGEQDTPVATATVLSSSSAERELESTDLSSDRYQIIGEAYVHGLMCGEAIQDIKRKRASEGTFVLV